MSRSRVLTIACRKQAFIEPLTHCRYRRSSSLAELHTELTSRRLPLTFDYLTPTPSHLLDVTLADFLPPNPDITRNQIILPATNPQRPLPPAHHLIYFPPATPPSSLLPDGTDPLQSPGPPFVRRMWAGGRILFPQEPPALAGKRFVCMEGIREVQIKGQSGAEKVFVGIERRIGPAPESQSAEGESELRSSLWSASSSNLLIERRNIVFMRSKTPSAAAGDAAAPSKSTKILKPTHQPTFSHTLLPTPQLLFRYSALTFNAHSIHLDKGYCRNIEGHRNLLVHGPLSLTLMVEVLDRHLKEKFPERTPRIAEIEYRNLAPLYAEEEMKVCGKDLNGQDSGGVGEFEVWVEGKEGGYAVKGKATTTLDS